MTVYNNQGRLGSYPHRNEGYTSLPLRKTFIPSHYSIAVYVFVLVLHAVLLQICRERHRRKTKVALNTIEVGNVIEAKERHSGFGQRWFGQNGLHYGGTNPHQRSRSRGFDTCLVHSMEQFIYNLGKGVVGWPTYGIGVIGGTFRLFQHFDNHCYNILHIDRLKFDLPATD